MKLIQDGMGIEMEGAARKVSVATSDIVSSQPIGRHAGRASLIVVPLSPLPSRRHTRDLDRTATTHSPLLPHLSSLPTRSRNAHGPRDRIHTASAAMGLP